LTATERVLALQRDNIRGLKLEPGALDQLNNLAATHAASDRQTEVESIWRAILEREPDYLFARASLGRIEAQRGHVAEARALLDPLLARRRMHLSEFATVAIAHIKTGLADGKPHEAKSWLEMWERALPDDPRVDIFRKEIRRRSRARPDVRQDSDRFRTAPALTNAINTRLYRK